MWQGPVAPRKVIPVPVNRDPFLVAIHVRCMRRRDRSKPNAQGTANGDHAYGYALSYLPGQRLSLCTCDGEDHPGPKHPDGSYVGRSAPEIDGLEAQVSGDPSLVQVSQSAQFAVTVSSDDRRTMLTWLTI